MYGGARSGELPARFFISICLCFALCGGLRKKAVSNTKGTRPGPRLSTRLRRLVLNSYTVGFGMSSFCCLRRYWFWMLISSWVGLGLVRLHPLRLAVR